MMERIHQEALTVFTQNVSCVSVSVQTVPLRPKALPHNLTFFKGESLFSVHPHYDYSVYSIISILNCERRGETSPAETAFR